MTDPQSDFEVYDQKFREVVTEQSVLVQVATGMEFTEGPVWIEQQGALIFSDIPADEMKIHSPAGLRRFRKPSGNANGNTLDREGRLLTCEHGNRCLSRTEPDGKIVILADSFNGKRLNSPNDVVVKSDGSIWFTDPPYGIRPEQIEQPHSYVFRMDGRSGELTPVADDFDRPNGLAFSPDETRLYVADSSGRHHIRIFEVGQDNALRRGQVFATIEPGVPDGMRVDMAGRLYSTAGDGVWVISPDGYLLGKILVPQTPANCCFGGPCRQTLYITARASVYAIELAATGAQRP